MLNNFKTYTSELPWRTPVHLHYSRFWAPLWALTSLYRKVNMGNIKVRPHYTARHTAAKVTPCHKYMWTLRRLRCSMPFDAAWPKNLIDKLSVPLKEAVGHWCCETLFSGTKTADRVALTPAPAIDISTKGRQTSCLYDLYGQRSVAVENNFGGKK